MLLDRKRQIVQIACYIRPCDAGVSLDDLLESRDGSDSGSPVLGRTALGNGPAVEDAGLRLH